MQRRHGLERDEAGDARDGRRRAGAAVREHRRADQGRSPREAATSRARKRVARWGSPCPLMVGMDRSRFRSTRVTHACVFPRHPRRGKDAAWSAGPGSEQPRRSLRAALGSPRAEARRHDDPAARAGAARGLHADRRSAAPRGDPRRRRLRVPRGLRRRRLRHRGAPRRREPLGTHPRAQRAHEDAARDGAARPLPRRLAPGRRRLRPALRRLGGRERDRRLPPPRPAERRREPARGGRGDHRGGQGVRRRARLRLRLHGRGRGARRAGAQAARARRRARPGARPVELARAAAGARADREAARAERPAGRPLLPGRGRERARRRRSRPRAAAPT